MILREIIYDVLEKLNQYSDDHKITEEQIAFNAMTVRNLLLTQYMSNLKKEIPFEAIQTICVPLELDLDCLHGEAVVKSVDRIPSTLDNTGRSNIIKAYTGSLFQKNINIIDFSRLPYIGSESFQDSQLFLTIDPHSHLIGYNPADKHRLLETIQIEGVFENPEEAYKYVCAEAGETPCDFYDAEYPIPSALVFPLVNQVVQSLLIKFNITPDKINNAEDDTNKKVSPYSQRRTPQS